MSNIRYKLIHFIFVPTNFATTSLFLLNIDEFLHILGLHDAVASWVWGYKAIWKETDSELSMAGLVWFISPGLWSRVYMVLLSMDTAGGTVLNWTLWRTILNRNPSSHYI